MQILNGIRIILMLNQNVHIVQDMNIYHEVTFSLMSQAPIISLNPSPVPQLYNRGLPLTHR